MSSRAVDFYFERFGFCPAQIHNPPAPGLGIIVVIPCHDEPDLIVALSALQACDPLTCAVEVIVVINSAEDAASAVLEQNEKMRQSAGAWMEAHQSERLHFHCLNFPSLPRKKAGVGLARKIGMDEAVRRFDQVNRLDGVIVCFDADCTCDRNYLVEIERHFSSHPQSPGASLYFEHPLEGQEDRRIYEAITVYELHLRYYVEALRYAGFPHAYHTIGSSMAVRARVYLEQGGMNKRQAGEDFYFLHKVIPLGGFGEINSTRVLPSPRASHRVPFGTGRAVAEYLESGKFESYPFQAFEDLRLFFARLPDLYTSDDPIGDCSEVLRRFLLEQEAPQQLRMIREHTASHGSFQRRFFRWFDGFLAMKYVHFARDDAYGSAELETVAREMYHRRTHLLFGPGSRRELLIEYRKLQGAMV